MVFEILVIGGVLASALIINIIFPDDECLDKNYAERKSNSKFYSK